MPPPCGPPIIQVRSPSCTGWPSSRSTEKHRDCRSGILEMITHPSGLGASWADVGEVWPRNETQTPRPHVPRPLVSHGGMLGGMRTTIDRAGRIVIPAELRRQAGLQPGMQIEIDLRDGRIEIEPAPIRVRLERRGPFLVAVP